MYKIIFNYLRQDKHKEEYYENQEEFKTIKDLNLCVNDKISFDGKNTFQIFEKTIDLKYKTITYSLLQ